jgi:beta-galactosidase
VHVGQWGTRVTTRDVSTSSAALDLEVTVDNDSGAAADVVVETAIHVLEEDGRPGRDPVATLAPAEAAVAAGGSAVVRGSVVLAHPRLWGPPPDQTPHR